MATEKIEEVLVFKVDQGAALTEMERTKRALIGLREEQQNLSKAYKNGDITLEEYAKEIVRVDALLKKTGTEYNNLTKKVAGVTTETSKLIKSNQQLSQSLKDSASQINVAGVNVGQLGTKIASLANPITASIALVGALGAAYARSTIGAKDLAFAQNQLSSAITIVTNDFASLISSAEDGEGAFTKILNRVLYSLGPAGAQLAEQSRAIAVAQEGLEDLLREEITIRGEVSERLADNQELLTAINEEQTTYEQKLLNISGIIGNLRTNQRELLEVNERELVVLNNKLAGDKENEELQTAVLQKEREISKIKSDTEKKIQAALRLEDNIRAQNQKQLDIEREKTRELERQTQERIRNQQIALGRLATNPTSFEALKSEVAREVGLNQDASSAMAKAAEDLARRVEAANKKRKESAEGVLRAEETNRDALRLFSSEAGRLYQTINQSSKGFAAAQLVLDSALTLSGLTARAAELGPIAGPIYFAAAVISAGANLTQAAQLIGADSGFNPTGFKSFQGEVLTASDGSSYAIGAKGEVIPLNGGDTSNIVTNKRGDTFDVNERSSRGLLYRLTHPFRALRKLIKFSSGGYTGDGDTYEEKGIVHAGEYVTPKRVVNHPLAQSHLKALENLRTGYAKGGFVGNTSFRDMATALRGARFEVAVVEINRAQAKHAAKVRITNRR